MLYMHFVCFQSIASVYYAAQAERLRSEFSSPFTLPLNDQDVNVTFRQENCSAMRQKLCPRLIHSPDIAWYGSAVSIFLIYVEWGEMSNRARNARISHEKLEKITSRICANLHFGCRANRRESSNRRAGRARKARKDLFPSRRERSPREWRCLLSFCTCRREEGLLSALRAVGMKSPSRLSRRT